MATLTKYCLFFLAGCLALASCSKDRTGDNDRPESPYLLNISVSQAPFAVADTDSDPGNESGPELGNGSEPKPNIDYNKPQPFDGKEGSEEIFVTQFVHQQSHLYVSQRTRQRNPFQADTEGEYSYYHYVYFDNDKASWDSGFNFQALDDPKHPDDASKNKYALNWETVRANGSVGNGFALYALYYPGKTDYPTADNRKVADDQSTLKELQGSDILGGFHSTSSLYSRVRFRMFHLMNYIKVNLYVPKFQLTGQEGEEEQFSGYSVNSLKKALIMNVCPDFTIDWAAGISSDARPTVAPPDNYSPEDYKNIQMYSHAHKGDEFIDETESATPDTPDTPDTPTDPDDGDNDDTVTTPGDTGDGDANTGNGEQGGGDNQGEGSNPEEDVVEEPGEIRPLKLTRKDISSFMNEGLLKIQPLKPDEDGKICDDVYLFSFSVIIPIQYDGFTMQTPGILKFQFEQPGSKIPKTYYFSGTFNDNKGGGFDITEGGHLQVLNLYLPRKGDEVVMINAEIIDWTDVDTDMNLPQKEPDKTFGEDSNNNLTDDGQTAD